MAVALQLDVTLGRRPAAEKLVKENLNPRSEQVIVSLLYLAVQIRQNTKIVVANAAKDTSDSSREWFSFMIEDPELGRIFHVGAEGMENLNVAERLRFAVLMFTYLKSIESSHYQAEIGLMDPDLWSGWDYQNQQYLGSPGVQAYWEERRNAFSVRFQRYVDSATTDPNFRRAAPLTGN